MFHRMRIYTVHIRPEDTGSRFKPLFIKEGFNFMAFVFTLLWALYHRLWFVALALLAFNLALIAMLHGQVLGFISVISIHLGVHVLVGYCGNDWLRKRLAKKGYILSDVTAADSFLRAQQRFLERYVAAA